jgi:hypothetical protein
VIRKCPSINVSFSEVGFPANLTSLSIDDMAPFNEAFFEWGLCKLTSLKQLEISSHSNSYLVSFPEMMLPLSLTSLTIRYFPNLKCLSSKGFQDLASFQELFISDCEKLTSFPEDGLAFYLKMSSARKMLQERSRTRVVQDSPHPLRSN